MDKFNFTFNLVCFSGNVHTVNRSHILIVQCHVTYVGMIQYSLHIMFLQLKDKVTLFLILLLIPAASFKTTDHDKEENVLKSVKKTCPPWKYKEYNSSCVCGNSISNVVICEDHQTTVKLLSCHCMSYSDKNEVLLVGNCPYLCTNAFYTTISNLTEVGNLCDAEIQQNRQGQMCGKCLDNFSPSPYSYTFECTECNNYKNNWLKYLLIAFLPLSLFFLFATIFRINAMSPTLNSYIFLCQIIGCPSSMSLYNTLVKFSEQSVEPNLNSILVGKFLSSLYAVWNLDFFRMMYKPFCLHPDLSILHILSLDYVIAVYPMFLICVTYFFIKLHDRVRVVQLLWKPAGWLFTRINHMHQWKTSSSLIQAFGTFFLLSYVKIVNTSFNLLMPVQLYNVHGKVVGLYVYYNGSMEYFGHDHLPYAMLAIFMFVIFNLVPLLLLSLYPCQIFQSCLNSCRLNSHVLRTFMDAFLGCYKFQPYDCRYWAAFYLFLRIAILGIFAFTQSIYFLLVTGILLLPVASLLSVVRPYSQNIYNVIDIIMILTLIQISFSAVGFLFASVDRRYELFINVMVGSGVLIPHIYVMLQVLSYILPSRLVEATKERLLHVLSKGRKSKNFN